MIVGTDGRGYKTLFHFAIVQREEEGSDACDVGFVYCCTHAQRQQVERLVKTRRETTKSKQKVDKE
jgi:hypothetical protein